jgi:hypothetical protein
MTSIQTKLALWIKSNDQFFSVLGVFFFVLTLGVGVLWIMGREVESVAFILSSISSFMFGVIEVANYIAPDRKLVRNMGIEELLQFVESTRPDEDWRGFNNGVTSESALKEDPRLRATVRFDDRGIHLNDFRESWAIGFPNPQATSYYLELTYDRALIERIVVVAVDGGRSLLPMPISQVSLKVSNLQYRLAELLNETRTLNDYFSRAGLQVCQTEPKLAMRSLFQ